MENIQMKPDTKRPGWIDSSESNSAADHFHWQVAARRHAWRLHHAHGRAGPHETRTTTRSAISVAALEGRVRAHQAAAGAGGAVGCVRDAPFSFLAGGRLLGLTAPG